MATDKWWYRWRKQSSYQSGRYLWETKPDFRLVSDRYLPVCLLVAADHSERRQRQLMSFCSLYLTHCWLKIRHCPPWHSQDFPTLCDKKVSLKGLDSTARRELPLHSSRIKERLDCVRFMKTWADICLPQSNLIPTPRALIKYKNLSTSSRLNIAKWLSDFLMNISASHVLHHLLFCTTHEEW